MKKIFIIFSVLLIFAISRSGRSESACTDKGDVYFSCKGGDASYLLCAQDNIYFLFSVDENGRMTKLFDSSVQSSNFEKASYHRYLVTEPFILG